MRRERLPIAAAFLSILTLGVAATVFESAVIATPYDPPAGGSGGANLSLLAVFQLLLVALLEFVGIELGSPAAAAPPSAAGALVSVLLALRSIAVPLLAVGAVVAGVVLVGRRLPDANTGALVTRLPGRRPDPSPEPTVPPTDWPPADPDADVSEAWVAMTAKLELDRPRARTPAEWADAAVEAGFDDDAVAELTRTFRAVRYGAASETPDRRRRAERELERLEADHE